LSESHWIGCGRQRAPKAPLHALEHQIPDHLPADAAGARAPGHGFPIAGVQSKGDSHGFTIPAGDLEAVGGPAQIGPDRDDLAVVNSAWRLAGVTLQQQTVLRHQAIDAFVVEPRQGLL
jgi:hypothetical protein